MDAADFTPHILETSEQATILLDDGSTVGCFQESATAFKVEPAPGEQVIVVGSESDMEGLKEAQRLALIIERAIELHAAGGKAARL